MNDKRRAAPPTNPEDGGESAFFRALTEIGIISQLASNAADRLLPDNVTLAQFTVLNHFVRLGGPRSPASLASSFQVTKGAITQIVKKLETKGRLTVTPDPSDGRGKLIDITPEGRALREECRKRLQVGLAPIFADISRQEIEAALPTLEKLRRLLDEKGR